MIDESGLTHAELAERLMATARENGDISQEVFEEVASTIFDRAEIGTDASYIVIWYKDYSVTFVDHPRKVRYISPDIYSLTKELLKEQNTLCCVALGSYLSQRLVRMDIEDPRLDGALESMERLLDEVPTTAVVKAVNEINAASDSATRRTLH